jgi:ATP-dependent Clp protease ATP-binding subunit ClpA
VADIGFENEPHAGNARLLVTRGVRFTGNDASISSWLRAGTRTFPSFNDLRDWIRGPLAGAFACNAPLPQADDGDDAAREPRHLTDMSAVDRAIQDIHRPLYIDEDALLQRLQRRILGQDAALRALAGEVTRHSARRRPGRPAVVFAVGPSGVGKTRTAESLAGVLRELDAESYGYQFLRLDMTEYQEAHRVSQLIGSPQGYIGHGDGSQLLDALRANARTIVLFDEIEKAHAAILRVLMNAMDAGRLSSASRSPAGREVDCRHSIFMFTSNLDAKEILDELESRNGFGNRAIVDEVCRRRLHAAGMAPEIVGRIGRFLVYRPLTPSIRAQIVALAVADVADEYGVDVAYVAPEVVVDLIQKARSESFGVRPERFLIDDCLGGVFAQAAAQRMANPVDVMGTPFRCEPHIGGRTAASVQTPAVSEESESQT